MSELAHNKELIYETLDNVWMIFAPRNSKDLRVQYKELSEYSEFKPELIKTHDLLFVWWFRCASSPYHDMDDSEKLELCIHAAYQTEQQRESKRKEFANGFPDNMRKAFRRMESFNLTARVQNMLTTRVVRENCIKMLKADTDNMDPSEQESYAKRAPGLWKLLQETASSVEAGGFGVIEREDTIVSDVDGTVRAYRQSRR
jgi:hypothetical protein